MNAYLLFGDVAWWSLAGWTMLHFLWLGSLVGLVAMVARMLLRRASPEVRYGVALVSLAALVVLPVTIGAWVAAEMPVAEAVDPLADVGLTDVVGGMAAVATESGPIIELKGRDDAAGMAEAVRNGTPLLNGSGGASGTHVPAGTREATGLDGTVLNGTGKASGTLAEGVRTNSTGGASGTPLLLADMLEACVPYLPWLWLVGTPLTFALLATGVIGAERLRRGSREIHDGPIAEACARLVETLGVTRRVTVAACERIAAPVLVGILRPIILLPPAALTGWSPDEIEMVLLHELAHVRRWDNLVNLVQRLVESLLFFHPAVWLVSGWVRREREACCDAVVVGRTNRPHAYAEMLVALAAQMPRSVLFHPAASSAMAAGPLRARIRRILQLEDDPMLVSGKSFAIVLAGLVVAATLAVLYLPAVGQAEDSEAATEESATEDTEGTESSEDAVEIDEGAIELDGAAEELDSAVDELVADELVVESPDGEVVIEAEGDRVTVRDDANRPESKRERVIATLPNPETSAGFEILFQAVDEARAKGLYVDYVPRGQTADLVVVPKPTEADWPAMLGDPPRKERVIADRAWKRLGLKLVPASRLEMLDFEGRRVGGAIKIVGGNLPKGLPLPAFVRQIGDTKPDSFDDLLRWLNSEKARSLSSYQEGVKVYAFADGHDYLFDAAPPTATKPYESLSLADGALKVSADDWPAGVAFPSPKEGEIARRAWKELGIKVAPASEAELASARRNGMRGGLKLVDFEGRLNLEGPFILTHLQARTFSTGIADFDALASALDALKSQPTDGIVVLNGIAGKGSVFQYSMRLPPDSAAAESAGSALFPSLQEQRLADLIYKAMDLEVEPIGEEELRRVKALGYEGGVLVAEAIGDAAGRFQPNDILVGLHVWPTTNMQEVVEVLSRDDLGELSPLKYYVVRSVADPNSAGDSTATDFVETGRIPVKATSRHRPSLGIEPDSGDSQTVDESVDEMLEQDPQMAVLQQELTQQQMRLAQLSSNIPRGGDRSSQEIRQRIAQLQKQIAQYRDSIERQVIERKQTEFHQLRPADWSGIDRPEADTLELRTQQPSMVPQEQLQSTTQAADPWSVTPAPAAGTYSAQPVRPTERGATAASPYAATPADPSIAPSSAAVVADPSPRANTLAERREKSLLQHRTLAERSEKAAVPADQPRVVETDKSRLRYDGRTFEEWRSTWRNELSTEKRMEAVKALAAFGSAGYGKEAAEAILDVVKQYDWSTIGRSPVSKLKNEAVTAFAGGYEVTSIPMDDWLPVLLKEVRSGDKQMTMFAYWVFRQVEYTDEDVVPRLIDLSRDDQLKDAQLGLLERLSQVHQQANDPRIAQRMVEALGEGPDVASLAIYALYPPSVGGMFGGGGIRGGGGMGRGYGGRAAPQPELEYRPELIDVLGKAEGPLADHVTEQVVSALTRLGPKAKPAVPRLLDLLMEADIAIARKLLWTIPAVTGSDQELRVYLNAVVEKAESPEKVKRADAMLKTLDKRRQQEAGAMRGGEMGMEGGGRGMMMENEMGGGRGFRGGEGGGRGYGGGYGGEGGRGAAGSTPGKDAAIEESATNDLFGPAEGSGSEGEHDEGGRGEAEEEDLFGPSE